MFFPKDLDIPTHVILHVVSTSFQLILKTYGCVNYYVWFLDILRQPILNQQMQEMPSLALMNLT